MKKLIKIATIIGARPQFVKAAVVSKALKHTDKFNEIILHTGQHYDENLSNVFFEQLEIPAAQYHLGVGSGSHAVQTARMLEGIESVLLQERPQLVLVYGDTNSTLAGALVASKLKLPVAHVEAGLRSRNRDMPEEINRIVADHLSTLLFAPTQGAVAQLHGEGIAPNSIHLSGDVMYDAALQFAEKSESKSQILSELQLKDSTYALCTVHRAENTDNELRLRAIFEVLSEVSKTMPVVLPLHPRTRNSLQHIDNGRFLADGIRILPPAGYLDMIALQKNAAVIVTDSGGVQKEAFFYRIPCVTLRNETEWPELVELGWNKLIDPTDVSIAAQSILGSIGRLGIQDAQPYGVGNAANRIADVLAKCL
jgi:UDP-GlcNAc3NAcA epimerase